MLTPWSAAASIAAAGAARRREWLHDGLVEGKLGNVLHQLPALLHIIHRVHSAWKSHSKSACESGKQANQVSCYLLKRTSSWHKKI